jgi:adenylate kinase
MNLIILGPQGSGKGTQANLLVEKKNLFHLETGKIFRNEIAQKTDLGIEAAKFVNQGKLVPDEIIAKILSQNLSAENFKKGILFDGFPRNLAQAELFEKELVKYEAAIDKVIYLNISLEESLKRLMARRSCPQCHRGYNLVTIPPKNSDICDDCGVHLIAREDETEEAIKERLAAYQKETAPLVNYYQQKNILLEINGERPIDVIHQEILRKLG